MGRHVLSSKMMKMQIIDETQCSIFSFYICGHMIVIKSGKLVILNQRNLESGSTKFRVQQQVILHLRSTIKIPCGVCKMSRGHLKVRSSTLVVTERTIIRHWFFITNIDKPERKLLVNREKLQETLLKDLVVRLFLSICKGAWECARFFGIRTHIPTHNFIFSRETKAKSIANLLLNTHICLFMCVRPLGFCALYICLCAYIVTLNAYIFSLSFATPHSKLLSLLRRRVLIQFYIVRDAKN